MELDESVAKLVAVEELMHRLTVMRDTHFQASAKIKSVHTNITI